MSRIDTGNQEQTKTQDKLDETPPGESLIRPAVKGKFLYVGDEKFFVRGVTCGTYRPDENGSEYNKAVVEHDLRRIAQNGLNSIRTYTVPPQWLLDAASQHGLRVLVGLPWEQHITFLDEPRRFRDIERRVAEGVRACSGHPAVLGYAIGSEIPASIVRWHGRHKIQRCIERLYQAAKAQDPDGLVTYVNYPSTEYLELPFLDLVCFNIYIESRERLEPYLARLHNIAGDRPLVIAELGLDSRRHGERAQAWSLDWQIRTCFESGCAGAFVFAWTDEWHRGGHDIEDWDFGITSRDRKPKPALSAVRQSFAEVPFCTVPDWPRISVVVCSYNGARTIRECLEGLSKLEYPNYEVIVVDDGSTDATATIASDYDFHLIRTENCGLSHARNVGLEAATGEIVAYIDDDAYPDPHWLKYLAATFMRTDHSAVGGPNIPPSGDGAIADCVANAPGGPVHVLISDREAEHIPGCNMAFRKSALQAIGGFDPQFRVAGDDVDVCWRIHQQGWTIGFSPAAVVWHHRRNSVRAYLKQQRGYGRAEALLEKKWPDKYNASGHLSWKGRIYGKGRTYIIGQRRRIYNGIWGSALFQYIYEPAPSLTQGWPQMPEWYLVILMLAVFSALGLTWRPLMLAAPFLVLSVGVPIAQAIASASRASFTSSTRSRLSAFGQTALTALLYTLQPMARLYGRLCHGLTPWRRRVMFGHELRRRIVFPIWSELWQSPTDWIRSVEDALRGAGAVILRGGECDPWDLEVRGGILSSIRLLVAVEEHGAGRQRVLVRSWPQNSTEGRVLAWLLIVLSVWAASDGARNVSVILAISAALLLFGMLRESWAATAVVLHALCSIVRRDRGASVRSADLV